MPDLSTFPITKKWPAKHPDRLQLYSFLFRMIAGVFFSALYLVRGFGITAWTHALYDLSLLLLQ